MPCGSRMLGHSEILTKDSCCLAVRFLEKEVLEKFVETQYSSTEQAKILVMEQTALIAVKEDDMDRAERILEKVKGLIDSVHDVSLFQQPSGETFKTYFQCCSVFFSILVEHGMFESLNHFKPASTIEQQVLHTHLGAYHNLECWQGTF